MALALGCAPGGPSEPGADPGPGDGTGGGGGGGTGALVPGLPTPTSSLLWSGVLEVAGDQDYAYAVCRHGFGVFERTDDEGWVPAARVDGVIGPEPRMAFDHPYAYVATDDRGLAIYSVQDPENPGLANSISSGTIGAADVAVRERLVYLLDPDFGFRIIDASDPRVLRTIGQFQRRDVRCIALSQAGDRAYLGTDDGSLVVVDLSGSRPESLGEYGLAEGIRILDLVIDGAVVHAVAEGLGVVSVNAAVPALVQELARQELPGAARVALDGDTLYVTELGAESQGIRLVSVAEPSSPAELAYHDGAARSVGVAGDRVLVAADEGGLYSLDVTDPSAPEVEASFGGPTGIMHVQSVERIVAVSTDQGVAIVDASIGKEPFLVDIIETSGGAPRLSLSEDLCVVVDRGGDGEGDESLLVVPMGEGAEAPPAEASAVSLPGLRDVALLGQVAAVALGTSGVATYHVEDPSAPELLSTLDLGGASADLIADGRQRLLVVDQSQPALVTVLVSEDGSLSVESTLDLPATPVDMRRIGDFLQLPSAETGLVVVDVSEPSQPKVLGTAALPGPALGADMFSGAAYVAAGSAGLRLVALDEPTSPRPYVFMDTPGRAGDVVVDSSLVYIADGQALLLLEQ
jgi:hypothetical protein